MVVSTIPTAARGHVAASAVGAGCPDGAASVAAPESSLQSCEDPFAAEHHQRDSQIRATQTPSMIERRRMSAEYALSDTERRKRSTEKAACPCSCFVSAVGRMIARLKSRSDQLRAFAYRT